MVLRILAGLVGLLFVWLPLTLLLDGVQFEPVFVGAPLMGALFLFYAFGGIKKLGRVSPLLASNIRSTSADSRPVVHEFERVQGVNHDFVLTVPKGWYVQTKHLPGRGLQLLLSVPQDLDSTLPMPFIHVERQRMRRRSLDEYISAYVLMSTGDSNISLLGASDVSLNGVSARRLELSFTMSGFRGRAIAYVVSVQDLVYTVLAAMATENIYDAWSERMEAICNSFALRKPGIDEAS